MSTTTSVNQNQNQQSTQQAQDKYFDLHVRGIGYLNRVREVKTKKSSYMACVICALHGSEDDVQKTYIDCNVVGDEANRLIAENTEAANSKDHKVLLGFKIGDIFLDTFTYTKGDKAGQSGAAIKGRLLMISWIKVDGMLIYERPPVKVDEPTSNNMNAMNAIDANAA